MLGSPIQSSCTVDQPSVSHLNELAWVQGGNDASRSQWGGHLYERRAREGIKIAGNNAKRWENFAPATPAEPSNGTEREVRREVMGVRKLLANAKISHFCVRMDPPFQNFLPAGYRSRE